MYARHKQYLTTAETIKRKLSYKKTALGRFRCSGAPLPLLALVVLDDGDIRPLLDLGLRLGEGTGGALSIFLLRSAADIFEKMATFGDAGVDAGK